MYDGRGRKATRETNGGGETLAFFFFFFLAKPA